MAFGLKSRCLMWKDEGVTTLLGKGLALGKGAHALKFVWCMFRSVLVVTHSAVRAPLRRKLEKGWEGREGECVEI